MRRERACNPPLQSMMASFRNVFRDLMPIISANESSLIFGLTTSGLFPSRSGLQQIACSCWVARAMIR